MTAPLPTPRLPLAARFLDALRRYYIRLAPARIAYLEAAIDEAKNRRMRISDHNAREGQQ